MKKIFGNTTLIIGALSWLLLISPIPVYADPSTNIVACWKLDESSGNAADSSGNGRTLTNTNTVTYAAGKINNAAFFATNNFLTIANNAVFSPGSSDFSLGGWFKTDTAGHYSNIEASKYAAGPNRQYNIDIQVHPTLTDGYIEFKTSSTGSDQDGVQTAYTFVASTWYYILVSKSGTSAAVYINGSLLKNETTFATISAGTSPFNLGNDGQGTQMTGGWDEFGYWSKALTSADDTTLYNAGVGLACPYTTTSAAKFNFWQFMDF